MKNYQKKLATSIKMIYSVIQVIKLGSNILKYLFTIFVIGLIGFGIYQMRKDTNIESSDSIDQTSTISTIQTDLRLAICDFDTINPILSNNRNVQEISKIIFDSLVTLDEQYKIQYCLAEEIAKADDLNYIIKLKKGILWQDGNSFTAYDVQFTIDQIKRTLPENGISTTYANNLSAISFLEVIDENTIKITLSAPVDFFEYNLTFPIMSQKYYENEDFVHTEKNSKPVATGMFKIENVDSNVIKLVQNDLYWNSSKNPMAKEININLYNSAGELYNGFKNGEVDLVDVKIDNVEEYIGSMGYKRIEYKSRDYDFLAFNTENELFANPRVRKAISKIIDKNNIVASCLGSGYVISNFSLDMGNWLYTKDLNIPANTDEAKQILIEDGWEYKNNKWRKKVDGKTLELTFTLSVNGNNSKRILVAENLKNQLSNFGITVNIKQLNNENFSSSVQDKNFEVILAGIECGYSPSLKTFFGENNLANYSNEQVREIMSIVSNTSDENALYENYSKLYDIYLEEAPYIGLYRNTDVVVYNQGLIGNIKANAFNLYCNIEKWYRQ